MRLAHWLVTLPATAILIDFAVANRQDVPVTLWPVIELTVPLWIVTLAALAVGLFCGVLVAWVSGRRWRRETRACRRRVAALESELRAVEARLAERQGGTATSLRPRLALAANGR